MVIPTTTISPGMMSDTNILIYFVRHDLRVADNPILHHLSSTSDHGFTHLLPIYSILPHQIEVSGFLRDGATSPYPEARSQVGQFWRTGNHRACFIAQSIWDMKENLTQLGSDLNICIGTHDEVLDTIVSRLTSHDMHVGGVWMISEEGHEEQLEEKRTSTACARHGIDFRPWVDEKYFIDDRDLKLESPGDLPDVFTTYRKMNEPLKERPRAVKPRPEKGSLPDPVEQSKLQPHQSDPFAIPSTQETFEAMLIRPLESVFPKVPIPGEIKSAHPFRGGESNGLERLEYLITSGIVSQYRNSRNGLVGADFSTKLSAYLSQGCVTARQVHGYLAQFEDGTNDKFSQCAGYGQGENEGSKAIRFELLWRDYMRLCTRKFQVKLFNLYGFRNEHSHKWKPGCDEEGVDVPYATCRLSKTLHRVLEGTTGHSLIDASQRELIFTGYTSNRARQNLASFFAKHLNIDWRLGAEWYEMMLVDYDVNSNWSNWQYVSGVGNDPRGEARIFNPVKQAFDYDKEGNYVRQWLPEIRDLERLENLFQPWTTPKDEWERYKLTGLPMAENPLLKVDFSVAGKPKSSRRNYVRRRGPGQPGQTPDGNGSDTTTPNDNNNNNNNNNHNNHNNHNPHPRNQTPRGGGYRGGRGATGGFRGRGYGGPRGGFQGVRGGWQPFPQQGRGYAHQQQSWSQPPDMAQ